MGHRVEKVLKKEPTGAGLIKGKKTSLIYRFYYKILKIKQPATILKK